MRKITFYLALIFFILNFSLSEIILAESFKNYIILLVPGTGVTRKVYNATDSNGTITQQDNLINYLTNELHIASDNIYTYGFTASDTDLKQKVSEFGIKNYKNPAGKDKETIDKTGITQPTQNIGFGLSQIDTSITKKTGTIKTAAVKDKILSEDATVPSAYLPKKIITISYGDGAQVVRGYLNSNELLKNGVFRNLNGTDFINEKVLENIKKTQNDFAAAQKQYDCHSRAGGNLACEALAKPLQTCPFFCQSSKERTKEKSFSRSKARRNLAGFASGENLPFSLARRHIVASQLISYAKSKLFPHRLNCAQTSAAEVC